MSIKTVAGNYKELNNRIKKLRKLDKYFTALDLAVAWDLSYRHVQAFMQFFRKAYDIEFTKGSRAYFYNRGDFERAYKEHSGLK